MENNNNDVYLTTQGNEQVYVLQPKAQTPYPQMPQQKPQPQGPSKGRKVGAVFISLIPWAILQVVQTVVMIGVILVCGYDDIMEIIERGRISDMTDFIDVIADSIGLTMLIYGIISAIGLGIFYMVKYVKFKELGSNLKNIGWRFWLAAPIAVIGAQLFAQGFVRLYQSIPIFEKLQEMLYSNNPMYEALNDTNNLSVPMVLGVVIFVPIAEELAFRGIPGGILRKAGHSMKFILIFTALFFAIAHGNIAQIIYVAVLGFAEGYMFVHKKTIIPTILMHMFYNFLGTMPAIEKFFEAMPLPSMALFMCAGLVIVAGAFFLAKSSLKKEIPVNAA